jgi:hypothetical protein
MEVPAFAGLFSMKLEGCSEADKLPPLQWIDLAAKNVTEVNAMRRRELSLGGRFPQSPQPNAIAIAKKARRGGVMVNKRARGAQRNQKLPFVPPENWYEAREDGEAYRIIIQPPGEGFRHVLTPDDVRSRLRQLPAHFLDSLEVVQFSRMTRKKQSFPCYGMQWGTSLYLYPIEQNLVEYYTWPPTPNQMNEARMYGGRWEQESRQAWKLVWTEAAVRDFYLNNILIHELGHLVDSRNTRYIDRERYAEWFAVEYGYRPSRGSYGGKRPIVHRHDRRKQFQSPAVG